MAKVGKLIQGLILFSTVFGAFFLWEVSDQVPSFVFEILATGWALFVIDSILTFIRPRISYYFGLVLALLTLSETLTQPEHYALVANGNLEATATLAIGSVLQVGIILAVVAYAVAEARGRSR
jgi:hypothetical protein